MTRHYSNIAVTTTLANAGITSGTTTIQLTSQTGYPTSFPFVIRIDAGTASEELMRVNSGAGTSGSPYVVTRGYGGTAAVSHLTLAAIDHPVIAADLQEPQDFMANDHIDVVVQYGAVGDGTTNDQPAIQNALNAASSGTVVYLPGGRNYALAAPITIPPGVKLLGTTPRGRVYFSPFDEEKSSLLGLATFSGTAMILIRSAADAGYSIDTHGVAIENINIVGWDLPASVSGIKLTGQVQDTVIKNVIIQGVTAKGVYTASYSGTFPNTLTLDQVTTLECGAEGFYLEVASDTQAINCTAASNDSTGTNGWFLSGCTNSHFVSCRAEHMPTNGFYITGDWFSANGSGGANFVDLSTDRNGHNGILVDARTGTGPFGFIGLHLSRDGRNANAGGGGYAAFNASHGTSVTNPIHISGITVFPGVDDDNSGVNSPQIGISADHCTSFEVKGGYVHAATTAVSDAGSNTVFIVDDLGIATGTTASPTRTRRNYANRVTTGGWYQAMFGDPSTQQLTTSRMILAPFEARSGTIDVVAVEVSTLGASSTVRLGVYADNGNGRPGALVADYGTVATTSTGVKTIDVNTTVIPGRTYWFAIASQGGTAATLKTLYANPVGEKFIQMGTATPTSLAQVSQYYQSSVSGALPNPFVYTAGQTDYYFPKVAIKWA